jgi:hypothetical protein
MRIVSPCRNAFWLARFFPEAERGPALLRALRRFASIWRSLARSRVVFANVVNNPNEFSTSPWLQRRRQVNDTIQTKDDDEPSRPLTEIEIFLIKVATVTAAILLLMFAAYLFVSSKADELAILKGGPAFWHQVENQLYKLADEPDLPEPKKAKIVAALRKISDRYRPYLDAVEGTPRK